MLNINLAQQSNHPQKLIELRNDLGQRSFNHRYYQTQVELLREMDIAVARGSDLNARSPIGRGPSNAEVTLGYHFIHDLDLLKKLIQIGIDLQLLDNDLKSLTNYGYTQAHVKLVEQTKGYKIKLDEFRKANKEMQSKYTSTLERCIQLFTLYLSSRSTVASYFLVLTGVNHTALVRKYLDILSRDSKADSQYHDPERLQRLISQMKAEVITSQAWNQFSSLGALFQVIDESFPSMYNISLWMEIADRQSDPAVDLFILNKMIDNTDVMRSLRKHPIVHLHYIQRVRALSSNELEGEIKALLENSGVNNPETMRTDQLLICLQVHRWNWSAENLLPSLKTIEDNLNKRGIKSDEALENMLNYYSQEKATQELVKLTRKITRKEFRSQDELQDPLRRIAIYLIAGANPNELLEEGDGSAPFSLIAHLGKIFMRHKDEFCSMVSAMVSAGADIDLSGPAGRNNQNLLASGLKNINSPSSIEELDHLLKLGADPYKRCGTKFFVGHYLDAENFDIDKERVKEALEILTRHGIDVNLPIPNERGGVSFKAMALPNTSSGLRL